MLQQFSFAEHQPADKTVQYVRRMLHGADIDPFSLEIARLSLSLTDVPNKDGWQLKNCDLFHTNPLEHEIPAPGLVLTNPPYEAFSTQEREAWGCDQLVKYAEILARTLPFIRENGIIGFVAPRSFLTLKSAAALRKTLATEFEIAEIAHFPDRLFTFAQAETCVLLARRRKSSPRSTTRYTYVDDHGVEAFRKCFAFGYEQKIDVARVARPPHFTLVAPLLAHVWGSLADNPRLGDLADIGRGIEFMKGCPGANGGRPHQVLRYVEPKILHHQTPKPESLVFTDADVRRWGTAATTGTPQVVVNAARASIGPWKVWALMDPGGWPTTQQLITVRPKGDTPAVSIEFLWAILTSPVGNAFMHGFCGTWHLRTQTYEALPLPPLRNIANGAAVELAVKAYVSKARAANAVPELAAQVADELMRLRLQVDAEVLKLYDLAPRDERAILDLFNGHPRPGVPFEQTEYYPRDFVPCFPLHEYLSPAFQRSTVGEIRKIDFAKVLSPEFKAALKRAVELYSDEEE
jgi:hypothetical protein